MPQRQYFSPKNHEDYVSNRRVVMSEREGCFFRSAEGGHYVGRHRLWFWRHYVFA